MSEPRMQRENGERDGAGTSFTNFIQRILFLLGVGIMVWVLYAARQVVVMAVTSAVLAVVMGGLATVLSQALPWRARKLGYRLALLVVLLSSAAVMYGLWMSFGPRVVGDLATLQGEMPKALESLKQYPFFAKLLSGESPAAGGSTQLFAMISSTALSMASGILGLLTSALLILITAIFLASDPNIYKGAIVSLFPLRMRQRTSQVLDACARGLWRWLMGQAFAMAVIGSLTTAGLYLTGMEYALTLGLMAGLLQFIPYVGPYLSAVPAVLVAVTVSPQMVAWVVLLYFVIQTVEGNLITPFVLQNRTDLPPAFTLISTVVFGVVFGPLGVIVATPLSVLLLVLFQELYEKEVLGLDVRSAGDPSPARERIRQRLEERSKRPPGVEASGPGSESRAGQAPAPPPNR